MAKILLVEDNEFNRDMLSRRLRRRGYDVVIAVDGLQGVEMAQTEQPDLILMDMSLPIMDGWEATRRLKSDPQLSLIPIIALTAHAMVGDRQKAFDAGCDEYDTKPIELSRLVQKMTQLLGEVTKAQSLTQNIADISIDDLEKSITQTFKKQSLQPPPPPPPLKSSEKAREANPLSWKVLDDSILSEFPEGRNTCILLVDDNLENRDMLGRRLERQGYQVLSAGGGIQALEILAQDSKIALVLLDIMMPDMDGIETLSHIRKQYSARQLPVIMATAKAESEDVVRAFQLGANDYITKPIDFPIAIARIQSQLALTQTPTEALSFTAIVPEEPSTRVSLLSVDVAELPSALNNPELESRYKVIRELSKDALSLTLLVEDLQALGQPKRVLECLTLHNLIHQELDRRTIQDALTAELSQIGPLTQGDQSAALIDAFESNQNIYCVREWIPGLSLAHELVARSEPYNLLDALKLSETLLRLLVPLHRNGIAHTDVQPCHFLQRSKDQKFMLINWGVRQRILLNLKRCGHDALGLKLLPSPFQAPETRQGESSLQSDLYGIGVILLQAITGRSPDKLPLDLDSGLVLWQEILSSPDSDLGEFFHQMMSPFPQDRFSSAADAAKSALLLWYKLRYSISSSSSTLALRQCE